MFRALLPLLVAALVPFAVIILIVTGTTFNLIAWQPPILQTTQFGGTNSSTAMTALSSDPSGIYTAGLAYGQTRYVFLNKYDLSGHQIWTEQFNQTYSSIGYSGSEILSVAVGAARVYVIGQLNYSSFVRGYDLNGNQAWNVNLANSTGSGSTFPTAISVVATKVYVGVYDVLGTRDYLESFSSNGSLVWTQPITNDNYTGYPHIYALPGSIYVLDVERNIFSGPRISLFQKYDSNGTLLWNSTVSPEPSGIGGDSTGIYTVGTFDGGNLFGHGFLAKYDFSGNQLWTSTFAAPGFNSFSSVELSADSSGVYLATTTTAPAGIVMKYDVDGNHEWSLQLPWKTGFGAFPSDPITSQDTGVYVGGAREDPSVNERAFLAQIGKSSSLVFFGVNPPFSFGLLALLAAVAVISVLWLRASWKKRLRVHGSGGRYRSQKIPSDMFRRN